jgi:hypothetical protein
MQRTVQPQKQQRRERALPAHSADPAADIDTTSALDHVPDPDPDRAFDAEPARPADRAAASSQEQEQQQQAERRR